MKTLAAVLVLVAAATSFGAVISFSGPATVQEGTAAIDVAVALDGQGTTFALWDAILQSDALDVSGFAFKAGHPFNGETLMGDIDLIGTFGENWIGGASSNPSSGANVYVGPVVEVGTLTIPTAALTKGIYSLKVDGDNDAISAMFLSTGSPVALNGSYSFEVTPEPATMALLALGGLLVARRRHA